MTASNNNLPLIVGISGASGIQYGVHALNLLRRAHIDTHLIVTKSAQRVRHYETDLDAKSLNALATVAYKACDIGCLAASGSFLNRGMLIAPCSMKTLAGIALGFSDSAIVRAAEVTLKERRPLVLLTRETPLTKVHLQHMLTLTEMGAVIAPPVPAFYQSPKTINDLVHHTTVRALDLFGIHCAYEKRWDEVVTER